MAVLEGITEVLHVIRAKLYPNYLQNAAGKYIARTRVETPLTLEQVCAAAVNRGGVRIRYEDLVEAAKAYLNEMAYQLADGFAVANDFFAVYPKIGGTFDDAAGPIDPDRNKPDFTFSKRRGLRVLLTKIKIALDGVAETNGYIGEVLDITTGDTDNALTPGGAACVFGHKLKIAGGGPSVGLYLVNQGTGERVKITGNFIDNLPGKLTVIVPALAAGTWRVEAVTRFTNGASLLKEARVIDYPVDLTVV